MPKKDAMDAYGATALVLFSALLGFNQVVIKVVNAGLQPAFFAGLRSAGGVLVLLLLMRLRGRALTITPGTVPIGLIIGVCFGAEFLFLFLALDYTTVVRTGILFYSMPVWLALISHFALPGDRMTPLKAAGLACAFGGVVLALCIAGGAEAALFAPELRDNFLRTKRQEQARLAGLDAAAEHRGDEFAVQHKLVLLRSGFRVL